MKHQYFGDVNDYRKYGLLRHLMHGFDGRLLVNWMLTPDDASSDGLKRTYLNDPRRFRHHDEDLFEGLRAGLNGGQPHTSLIEQSGLLGSASFFGEVVPDGLAERLAWGARALDAAPGHDLVFLDPDNGLEVGSRKMGRQGSSKYASRAEIAALWAEGYSILLYQHFPRVQRQMFLEGMFRNLTDLAPHAALGAFLTRCVHSRGPTEAPRILHFGIRDD